MKNYYKALARFQQECPVLLKDTDGYNYKYVDLTKIIHSINPLMKKHGLGFTQMLGTNPESGNTCVTTTIFHVDSGESDSSTVDIPMVALKGQNDYQSIGSGCSYFKRYQLSSALGIVSDKDVDAYGEQESVIEVKIDKPKPELDVMDMGPVITRMLNYKKEKISFSNVIKKIKAKYTLTTDMEKVLKLKYNE